MENTAVKAEPWRALKYNSPFFLVAIFYFCFYVYIKFENNNCEEVLGIPIPHVNLFFAIYGIVAGIFVASIYQVFFAYKILKFKANPPPGIPVFINTKVTYRFLDKIYAVALLTLYPVFAVGALCYGNVVYIKLMDNKSVTEHEIECMQSHNQGLKSTSLPLGDLGQR